MDIKLNLGCSDDLKSGYINVDRCVPDGFKGASRDLLYASTFDEWDTSLYHLADFNEHWPLADSHVDEIYAKDVFEHVSSAEHPGNRGKIWVMNESYRVLKPNGLLEFLVPCVHLADGRVNPGAFADPTHASFWTHDDRYYFTEEWNNPRGERGRLGPAYGIACRFNIESWELEEYGLPHERRSKVHARLRAVKP